MSLYVLDRNSYNLPATSKSSGTNPYKGKRRVKDEDEIPLNITNIYTKDILEFVLYDVYNTEALRNFKTVQNNTHCIFSKRAILWGARDYDVELSIGEFSSAYS